MKTRMLLLLLVLIAVAGARPLVAQQVTPDIIRGRVTGPDSQPIPNVVVTTVSFLGGIEKTTKTDKNGRFSIAYPNPEGNYWVKFNAIGYAPRQFELKRIADEAVLIADTRLSQVAQTLSTVEITATAARQPPPRTGGTGADISGTERYVSATGVPVELAGNLAAMAATIPGIQLIPGIDGNLDLASALGIDPSQNGTTLNGVPTNLGGLPTDFLGSASFRTSSADPSVGGFSGLQTSINSGSGTNFIQRRLSTNFTAPQVQWTDNVGSAGEYTNLNLGGSASGPIQMNKSYYWSSYSVSRNLRDQLTLLSAPARTLQNAGVSPDSAERLTQILGNASIPASSARVPGDATSDQANLIASIDFSPRAATSGHAYKLTVNGSWRGNQPIGLSSMSMPTFGGKTSNTGGGIQLRHTNYLSSGILTQTSVSVQGSNSSSDPFLRIPSGSVRVASELDDGSVTQRNLQFGGSSNVNESSQSLVSFQNSLFYVTPGNKHTLRLISELRHEGFENDSPATLGTFSYQSLADLEANLPSSYSRRLTAQRSDGSALIGAIGIMDSWIPKVGIFQAQYSVRLESAKYFNRPAVNPLVAQTFGVRNDVVPSPFYISPRASFQWTYGQAKQIPLAQGFAIGPRAVFQGGIGAYRSVPGASFLSSAIANTGLAGSTVSLSCVGDATPIPDWDAYRFSTAAVPTTCADGSEGTVFASTRPNVTMFDRNYKSPVSVNANLGWSGGVLDNRFNAQLLGTYSLQLNQTSSVDLNFNPAVQFTLDNEASRPVFVQASSIVPATGLIAAGEARVSDQFGRVSLQKSDLRAEAKQISINLRPLNYNPTSLNYSFGYAYLHRVEEFRGFSNTAGNPLDVRWGGAPAPRHSLNYSVSYNFGNTVTLTYQGQLSSPTRFTPLIAGDVNGDGNSNNDRAFVFDPATAADPAVVAGMQSLLQNGSASARSCLQNQLGRIGARNSCSGPRALVNQVISLRLNPQKVWLPARTSIELSLSNPLAAADLLLHGDNKLHGWGQRVNPDQALLYVRGFDPGTNRYRYEVNQRFGSTSLSQTTSRVPATLGIRISYDIGPPRDWQNFRMQLERGRSQPGTKMAEAQTRAYSQTLVINPMARIMQAADTLKLSRIQADSIANLSRSYTLFMDSLWTPTAKYMARLDSAFNRGAAQDRFIDVRNKAIDYLIKVVPHVKSLLTAGQRRMLPSFYAIYLETRYLENMRNGGISGIGIPILF